MSSGQYIPYAGELALKAPLDGPGGDAKTPRWNNATRQWEMVDVYTEAEADAAIAAAVGAIDLTAYMPKAGGTFTGLVYSNLGYNFSGATVSDVRLRQGTSGGFPTLRAEYGDGNNLTKIAAASIGLGYDAATRVRYDPNSGQGFQLGSVTPLTWTSGASPDTTGSNLYLLPSASDTLKLSSDGSGGAANLAVTGAGTFGTAHSGNTEVIIDCGAAAIPILRFSVNGTKKWTNYTNSAGGWAVGRFGASDALIIDTSDNAAFSSALSAASLATTGHAIIAGQQVIGFGGGIGDNYFRNTTYWRDAGNVAKASIDGNTGALSAASLNINSQASIDSSGNINGADISAGGTVSGSALTIATQLTVDASGNLSTNGTATAAAFGVTGTPGATDAFDTGDARVAAFAGGIFIGVA